MRRPVLLVGSGTSEASIPYDTVVLCQLRRGAIKLWLRTYREDVTR